MGNKRMSHQTHDTVSQIFKLISDKDTKQQGLQKLYDFKVSLRQKKLIRIQYYNCLLLQQQNPEIDLSTFLQGSSATFHKYIEEGLAEIERTQNAGSTQAPDNSTG